MDATAKVAELDRPMNNMNGAQMKEVARLIIWEKQEAFRERTPIRWAATPFYNSVNDFFTLVRFISPIKEYYNTGSITEVVIGWEPFQVPDDDPAAILRLSHSTIEKFIASPDVDSLAAGVLIGLVMGMCMIRRTLFSCIPFGSTRKIGNDIPPQYSRVIHTCFHPTMQPIYTTPEEPDLPDGNDRAKGNSGKKAKSHARQQT
ncbi:hypothetical protein DTO027B5_4137 [Paecilomyces variotii]|nr:hypothetical protein DTO027B3_4572 [Paecilomyces variotii]KAJ9334014.1 hypothetical protein DTO027B5_4137 [Paecilomyces variotii]KAJ9410662.1 hypothetical protein DTO045G8_1568 [Paecilomyces variotii]